MGLFLIGVLVLVVYEFAVGCGLAILDWFGVWGLLVGWFVVWVG